MACRRSEVVWPVRASQSASDTDRGILEDKDSLKSSALQSEATSTPLPTKRRPLTGTIPLPLSWRKGLVKRMHRMGAGKCNSNGKHHKSPLRGFLVPFRGVGCLFTTGGYGDSAFISFTIQRSLVRRKKCTATVTGRKKNRRVHGPPSG